MSEFKLTAKQQEATDKVLTSGATHVMLFGGSRSGKTFLFCRAVAVRALKAPESRHAILRFRFNHVKNSIVHDTWPKVMRLCFPSVKGNLNKTDYYYQFPNGSQVWFGGLDDKERTEKILGMEFVTIYNNECSQIAWKARETVLTRLAQQVMQKVDGMPEIPLQPKEFCDCNPPSKAHWSYKLFIKKINLDTKKTVKNQDDYAWFKMNPEDNMENLSAGYLKTLEALGAAARKRFLHGDFAEVTENALFNDLDIEKWRVVSNENLPEMVRIVVPVDPSGSGDVDNEHNDSTGIAVCGLGSDGNGYLLADLTVKAGPATWGRIVTDAFERYEANAVVGETNFGGAMVEHVVQTARARTPYIGVRASRGKSVRAEPVAALYEQGRIRHVGYYPELEEELIAFTTNGYLGENSPNRADAVIWGFTELFGGIVNKKKKPISPKNIFKNAGSWMG
jgi:predicted phage terminase large subunit-like protein